MKKCSPRISGLLFALAMTISAGCDQSWNAKLQGKLLDPNRYRAQIAAIDDVLFANGTLKVSDRHNLEDAMLTIADAADDDPNNELALESSLDLRLLSTMAWSDQGSGPVANSELTRQWRRIRGSLFTSASWFRQSAPRVTTAPPKSAQLHRLR